jgi:ribosomal-protein-serine acetyltransferase
MLAIPESISDGGRIDLVPVAASHIQELYEAIVESKDELSPWMEWLHPDYSLADTEQWAAICRKAWEADSMFGFTIIENQTGQILGGCSVGITSHLHRNGAIGYWIRSSRTKQGFASEAAGLLAQFGFRQVGLIRIEILVAVGNMASERVAEKMGAVREGRLRNRLLFRGQPRDAHLFALVPGGGGWQLTVSGWTDPLVP